MKRLLMLFVVLLSVPVLATETGIPVASPDSSIVCTVSLSHGRLYYDVTVDDRPVLRPSELGFRFRRGRPFVDSLEVTGIHRESIDTTWTAVWGASKTIRDHGNELAVRVRETVPPYRPLILTVRACNDGVAFRYIFPRHPEWERFQITSEETRFRFNGDPEAWWIPGDYDSYEYLYNHTRLSGIDSANTPVTFKTTDGLYLSLHEAALTDYAGMTLTTRDQDPLTLKTKLVPWPDGTKVKAEAPFQTPWRTLQIARQAGDLITSNLIINLNEPCRIRDTSWITPMTYMGIWWELHIDKSTWHAGPDHGATTENTLRYMDFAAEHNIGGVLVEGWNRGWEDWGRGGRFDFLEPYDDLHIKTITDYGREKGVALIGHHETGADVLNYEKQMEAAFQYYRDHGVPAVKTGYVGDIRPQGQHHHGQWMVNHYRRVVETAARHRILLDVHEPIKPTGIRRTWPNMMTREGVRGMEYNAWSPGNPPEHTLIVPFTRMLAGPVDYTPGIFNITLDPYRPDNRVYTTRAKQLALMVVLYSPLQMAADLPEHYDGVPEFQFIHDLPADWDDVTVIDGEIGEHLTLARRHHDDWYVGSLTNASARTLELPLDFLSTDRSYTAEIYADAPDAHWDRNPMAVVIRSRTVTSGDTLRLELAPGGGQAIRLTPEVTP
jgi:alpha-glucosidase